MNQKHQAKLKAREARQARQARRVINGIFIGLIVLMICSSSATISSSDD